ncbi:MAG: hypothetical protein KA419_09200 [Acidobacteria bacterium]|nr:hypothetical protein [Acidobacteriota bacterium]
MKPSFPRPAVWFLLLVSLAAPLAAQGSPKLPFADDDSLDALRSKIEANGYRFTVDRNWVYDMPAEQKRAFLSRRPPATPADPAAPSDAGPLQGVLGKLSLPAQFDWRNVNGHAYIGPVRNQGGCGSCYAFGANAAAEGVYNFATGRFDANCADFSESYIIWCLGRLSEYRSHFYGCSGADYTYSELQALVDYGVCDESLFPYQQNDPGSCTHWSDPVTRFSGWYRVPCGDVDAIKTAILTYGVVDAAVYAGSAFQAYSGGIYEDTNTACSSNPCYDTPTNHAIALVGWNDAEGVFYLRNSWGAGWGEGGYMRIKYTSAIVACEVCYLVYDVDPNCTYQMNPAQSAAGWTGGTGSFTVSAGVGCTWTAMTNSPWVHITSGNSGSGNGTVQFAVDPNNDPVPRTGSVRLNAGLQTLIHTVQQGGAPPVPPAITSQSGSQEVSFGQSVTLSVTATGTNPLTYQWYTGPAGDVSTPVSGATSATLKVKPRQTAVYWVRVGNAYGHADSAAVTLTVNRVYRVAHLAGTPGWWTRLTLVNTGAVGGPVRFDAYGADGQPAETRTLDSLGAGEQFTLDAAADFTPETLARDPWMTISTRTALAGVLAFGTADGQALVTLPLDETDGDTDLVFPYVFVSPGQSGAFYTGITLVNPGTGPVQADLDAYADSGEKLATRSVLLPGNGKAVRLVEQVFADLEDPGRIRYVRAHAETPLLGFELFGKLGDQGLAGLPARPLNASAKDGETAGASALFTLVFNEVPDDAEWFTGVTFTNLDNAGNTCTVDIRDRDGNPLSTAYVGLYGRQQLTREVWAVLGGHYPGAAWFRLDGARRMMGFELMVSRTAPFRFDGLEAFESGLKKFCFPLTGTPGVSVSRLRLTNVSASTAEVTLRGFNAAGTQRAAHAATLPAGAVLSASLEDLFGAEAPEVAWIRAESTQPLAGDLRILPLDGSALGCYPGLELE